MNNKCDMVSDKNLKTSGLPDEGLQMKLCFLTAYYYVYGLRMTIAINIP